MFSVLCLVEKKLTKHPKTIKRLFHKFFHRRGVEEKIAMMMMDVGLLGGGGGLTEEREGGKNQRREGVKELTRVG